MDFFKPLFDSRVWEAVSGLAAVLNIGFFVYYIYDSYFKNLKFELYVDNWVEVRTRCCDSTCENPHLDFKCTVVAIGPKDKVSVLNLAKTLMKCPSGNNVEVSPNNHRSADGTYWGNHTPIILSGGDKHLFTISYKPELDKLKAGTYEIEIKLKSKDGKYIASTKEKIEITADNLVKLSTLPCNQKLTLGVESHF